MESVSKLLSGVEIPDMFPARQFFPRESVDDWKKTLTEELEKAAAEAVIRPGMRLALTVGSRGIDHIVDYLKVTGEFLRKRGANPFLIPAMGSHGGATAEGQLHVLEELGICEHTVDMEICSSMDTVLVGTTGSGIPVYADRIACEADGIVLVNRVKAHTQFRGKFESGLLKMLVIGLGKQKGAESCHCLGLSRMSETIREAGEYALSHLPVLFGLGLVENAYDKTMRIEGIPADQILRREPELLTLAKRNMPHICVPDLDVLIVDRIGKNYSGSGMDPNVTGRFYQPNAEALPAARRIVVLGLSEETNGNACGIGVADTTTMRIVKNLDRESMYMNGLTSCVSESSRIPLYFENDRDAIRAAIKLTGKQEPKQLRIARISNTMQLEYVFLSEALAGEVSRYGVELIGEKAPLPFDEMGNLF